MPGSFRQQVAADVRSLFLRADKRDAFGSEPATWTRRTAAGIETTTVEVVVESSSDPANTDRGGELDEEAIDVFVARGDGGIDAPQHGDRLTRGVAYDTDQRPYVFRGDVREAWPEAWLLRLFRRRVTAIGG